MFLPSPTQIVLHTVALTVEASSHSCEYVRLSVTYTSTILYSERLPFVLQKALKSDPSNLFFAGVDKAYCWQENPFNLVEALPVSLLQIEALSKVPNHSTDT